MGAKAYTYILRCADGSLYTGWTNDLAARIAAHNSGHGAKYTRSRRPVELVYFEELADKSAALSREWHIKHMTREQKSDLIAGFPVTGLAQGKATDRPQDVTDKSKGA